MLLLISLTSPKIGFTLDAADIDVAVESFYNVAEDEGAGVTSSSEAGEFVKIDNSADVALGNGGDDTYVVGADQVFTEVSLLNMVTLMPVVVSKDLLMLLTLTP